MTIVLDLDDVLANLREALFQSLSKATGIQKHWRDWPHYNLTQHFGMEKTALEALLVSEQVMENCLPEPDAVSVTRTLREQGFRLAVVTARGWHDDAHALTADWLQRHDIGYDHLRVVAPGGDKVSVLGEFERVLLAVDDHPSNIRRYSAAGVPSLMVDMPWNGGAEYPNAARIAGIGSLPQHADRHRRQFGGEL